MFGKALLNDSVGRKSRNLALLAIVGIVLAGSGGCDKVKEAAKAAVEKGKEVGSEIGKAGKEAGKQITDAGKKLVDKGKEAQKAVDTNGFFEIKAEGEVNASACYAMFVEPVGGRRSLLQLRSYKSSEPDYPAVLVHAPVDAAALADLATQKVEARMFIQDENGTVWENVDGEPVTLTIDSVDDKQLKATFSGGQLRSSKTGESHSVSGTLTAVVSK